MKQQDSDPKAFLGFCTCDEDALYFVHEGGTFYLDYELTTPAKKARAANFRSVAEGLDLPVIDTSYSGEYPVLRVNVGTSEAQAAKIGMEFPTGCSAIIQIPYTSFCPNNPVPRATDFLSRRIC